MKTPKELGLRTYRGFIYTLSSNIKHAAQKAFPELYEIVRCLFLIIISPILWPVVYIIGQIMDKN